MARNTPTPEPAEPSEPLEAAEPAEPSEPIEAPEPAGLDAAAIPAGVPEVDEDPVVVTTVETVAVVAPDDLPDELREDDDELDDDFDDDDDEEYLALAREEDLRRLDAAEGPGVGSRVGAEAFGTFALVLVILGIALYNPLWTGQVPGLAVLGLALAAGLALAGLVAALGHVSGGHFNPAVTLGSALAGRTSWTDLPLYWLAQLLGAIAAAAVLFVTIPKGLPALIAGDPETGEEGTARSFLNFTTNGWDENSPLSALAGGQVSFDVRSALILELVSTAILVAVYLGTAHRRVAALTTGRGLLGTGPSKAGRAEDRPFAPVAIGLTYAALLLLTAPVTGGSLNPARSSAAALFAGGDAIGQLWLFWVAPLVGAAIVGLIYRAVIDTASDAVELEDEDDLVVERH
jgi:aquaporin Z